MDVFCLFMSEILKEDPYQHHRRSYAHAIEFDDAGVIEAAHDLGLPEEFLLPCLEVVGVERLERHLDPLLAVLQFALQDGAKLTLTDLIPCKEV